MSFSPESFDRLLADKLTQVPEPAYQPAHWDQLEDQLQHLNQALQAASQVATPAAPAAVSGATAGLAPVAGMVAKVGFAALLTGLTAVNGYFFYAATVARDAAAPATPTPTTTPMLTAAQPLAAAAKAPATPLPSAGAVRPVAAPPAAVVAPVSVTAVVRATTATTRPTTPVATPTSAVEVAAVPVRPAGRPVSSTTTWPVDSRPAAVPAHDGLTVVAAPAVAAAVVVAAPSPDSVVAPRAQAAISKNDLPEIFNIITPNGDGLNDRFELPAALGACRLTVFDRANRVVYTAERYANDWDGGRLPAGQYLYILEALDSANPVGRRPGGLTIQR